MKLIDYIQQKYLFSRSKSKNFILNNRITLNGKIITDCKKYISINDQIDIIYPKTHDIIWENQNIIIIYKLPEFSVARNFNTPSCEVVVNEELSKIRKLCKTQYDNEFGLVHRLDKETSGLLILCKNQCTLNKLLYFHKQIHKGYDAFFMDSNYDENINNFHGFICEHNRFIITNQNKCLCNKENFQNYYLRINHDQHVDSNGTLTITGCKKYFNRFQCYLQSGKKHQIRILMQHIKYPIIGDKIYNKSSKNKKMLLFANYISLPMGIIN